VCHRPSYGCSFYQLLQVEFSAICKIPTGFAKLVVIAQVGDYCRLSAAAEC
jgi:hypothetical protein